MGKLTNLHFLPTIKYVLREAAQILFPPRCYVCLKENTWLCKSCAHTFPVHSLVCVLCQKPSPRGLTCLQCRLKTALTGLISAGAYTREDLRRGLHWLKFKGVRDMAPILAERVMPYMLSIGGFADLKDNALIIPIPLYKSRERQRGFNQSGDIALALSELTHIPVSTILHRSKSTLTQKELPAKMRGSNMRGAFSLTSPLPLKRWYILIDDVTTTGSTLSAAAEALQTADGSEIWGVTIAHG